MVAQDKQQPAMSNDKSILLSNDSGGQEGGAYTKKIIPKSVKCDEDSCQFSVELEDETSTQRVLANHRFVAHGKQTKHCKQKLSSKPRGHNGGAIMKIIQQTRAATQ